MPHTALIYNIVFLPVLLFIGVRTSLDDLRFGLIRNKWILTGTGYVLIAYLSFWLTSLFAGKIDSLAPLLEAIREILENTDLFVANLLISLLAAYFIWKSGIWGAGDAKLFFLYAALVPIGQYKRVYFNYYFASFALLMNIFVIAAAFFLLCSIHTMLKNAATIGSFLKDPKSLKNMNGYLRNFFSFKVITGFMSLFMLSRIVRYQINYAISQSTGMAFLEPVFIYFISFLFFPRLSAFFKNDRHFLFPLLVAALAFCVFPAGSVVPRIALEFSRSFGNTLIFAALFALFNKMANQWMLFTKKTPFAPWMFLGMLFTWFF